MENFITKNAENTNLYIKVIFDFDFVARSWVIKEEKGTWKKSIIIDSQPGSGFIPFSNVGKTKVYKDSNNLVINTYLDLQTITNVDEFLKNFNIKYNLLEDDDATTIFSNSSIYKSSLAEIVFNSLKTKAMFTKVIQIL